jgi:hypothetical protein
MAESPTPGRTVRIVFDIAVKVVSGLVAVATVWLVAQISGVLPRTSQAVGAILTILFVGVFIAAVILPRRSRRAWVIAGYAAGTGVVSGTALTILAITHHRFDAAATQPWEVANPVIWTLFWAVLLVLAIQRGRQTAPVQHRDTAAGPS